MKELADERGINLEDVYREATEDFLKRRESDEIAYRAAPFMRSAD